MYYQVTRRGYVKVTGRPLAATAENNTRYFRLNLQDVMVALKETDKCREVHLPFIRY